MIKEVLTKSRKKMIKRWLKDPYKERICPFLKDITKRCNSDKYCSQTCGVLFPKSKVPYSCIRSYPFIQCPCDKFSVKYVIRKANQFIK